MHVKTQEQKAKEALSEMNAGKDQAAKYPNSSMKDKKHGMDYGKMDYGMDYGGKPAPRNPGKSGADY